MAFLYFYIADVIVRPELRGSGYGMLLMKAVIQYVRGAAHPVDDSYGSMTLRTWLC